MLAHVMSATIVGVEAVCVEVEAHLGRGLPAFNLVGLPDAAVQESKERVRAAIASSGLAFPMRRLTVNLAPGDIRKVGPVLDLPIALAVLCAAGELPAERLEGTVFMGEMGLDGSLRHSPGVLPVADMVKEGSRKGLVLPLADLAEASLVSGASAYGADSLSEVVAWLRGETQLRTAAEGAPFQEHPAPRQGDPEGLAHIKGQEMGKRAMEIAAAGGHNLLLVGPAGSGKTMLAGAMTGLLPRLTEDQAIEVAKIRSVARLARGERGLPAVRPFRAPHHSVTSAGLLGGGPGIPRPGEISLAHRGVLFLDEFAEFRATVLDGLRQPLQDGYVDLVRSSVRCRYPARFQLVAAANPCRCGFLGDERRECVCTPGQVTTYRARFCGPLIDRFDMQVKMGRPSQQELASTNSGEAFDMVRGRIDDAVRIRQCAYGSGDRARASASLAISRLAPDARAFMMSAFETLGMSVRGAGKVADVAATISALSGAEGPPSVGHVAEALSYRFLDAS